MNITKNRYILLIFMLNLLLIVCNSFMIVNNPIYISIVDRQDVSKTEKSSINNIYELNKDKVVNIQCEMDAYNGQNSKSYGTGAIIAKSKKYLYIITNYHVIKEADKILINNDIIVSSMAEKVGENTEYDFSIVRIDNYYNQIESFDLNIEKKAVYIGDEIVSLGNAIGQGISMSYGIISAIDRVVQEYNENIEFIQIDAAINEGCSGGPLINMNNEMVGIATMNASPMYTDGIAYAIPIYLIYDYIIEILNEYEL